MPRATATKKTSASPKRASKAASTNSRLKNPPPQQRRRKKRVGHTSAEAKRATKIYGGPTTRLQRRVAREAQQGTLTPLRPDDNLLQLKDAAKRLGLKIQTLRQWVLKGRVVYRRIGGLMLFIPESEVERLRDECGN